MLTFSYLFYITNTDRLIEKRGRIMVIKGARTIAEYRQIQAEKIQDWIDSNFVEGSVTWEMNGANAIKVTDRTGDSMVVLLDKIR